MTLSANDEAATFEEIKRMPDAEKQAKEVQEFIGRGVKTLADARTVRVAAVEALYAAGWTQAEIGKHMGNSRLDVQTAAERIAERAGESLDVPLPDWATEQGLS